MHEIGGKSIRRIERESILSTDYTHSVVSRLSKKKKLNEIRHHLNIDDWSRQNCSYIDFYLSLSNTSTIFVRFVLLAVHITTMKFIQLTVHRDKNTFLVQTTTLLQCIWFKCE